MMPDSFDAFTDRPRPHGGCRSDPQGEQMGSIRIDCGGRCCVVGIDQRHFEMVTEYLKSGELPNEIRIDDAANKQLQHIANVTQFSKVVAEASRFSELTPQPDKDGQFQ